MSDSALYKFEELGRMMKKILAAIIMFLGQVNCMDIVQEVPSKQMTTSVLQMLASTQDSISQLPEKPIKKWVCKHDGCHASFVRFNNLTTHKRTHTGEKPHKCNHEGCNKQFAQADGLSRHQRTHTGEKICVCNHKGCTSAFTDPSVLNRHKRTHTGKRPYVCGHEQCNAAFTQSNDLTNHKRTHTGEKPYRCNHEGCDKQFAQTGGLSRHKKTHDKKRKRDEVFEKNPSKREAIKVLGYLSAKRAKLKEIE